MKITKTKLKQIIMEEMEKAKLEEGMTGNPMEIASAQGQALRQIYEAIGQYQMSKSFGFHPEITQRAVDSVLELVDQIPSRTGQSKSDIDSGIAVYGAEEPKPFKPEHAGWSAQGGGQTVYVKENKQ